MRACFKTQNKTTKKYFLLLSLNFFFKKRPRGFAVVVKAGPDPVVSSDPPASASQLFGRTGAPSMPDSSVSFSKPHPPLLFFSVFQFLVFAFCSCSCLLCPQSYRTSHCENHACTQVRLKSRLPSQDIRSCFPSSTCKEGRRRNMGF